MGVSGQQPFIGGLNSRDVMRAMDRPAGAKFKEGYPMSIGISTGNNLSSLFAQRALGKAFNSQQSSLQKLSSGFKINQASDNPAGLIISEYLRGQLGGIEGALRNTQEAHNTLSIAEGALSEVSSMLTGMRSLAVHALNSGVTSSGQTSADQAELNSLIGSISRIVSTTSYANMPLLNGSQAIAFNAAGDTSILDSASTHIDLTAEGAGPVEVQFTGGAENQAEKAYVESAAVSGGSLSADTTVTVQGSGGEREFSFAAGTTVEEMAETINTATDSIGVEAYAYNGGTQLRLVSEEYGANASVQVEQGPGDPLFAAEGETVRDQGQNATVNIKGIETQTDGLTASVANSAFTGTLVFNEGNPTETTIAQTGYDQDTLTNAETEREVQLGDINGGIRLQLAESAGAQSREVFGLANMNTTEIGRVNVDGEVFRLSDLMSGGSAALANNPEVALAVIDQAIADVNSQRAHIGAYQSGTLQRNINSFSVAAENIAATESNIRDTNVAQEVTNFIRSQILTQVGLMNVQSSNTNAQNVLRLLGEG